MSHNICASINFPLLIPLLICSLLSVEPKKENPARLVVKKTPWPRSKVNAKKGDMYKVWEVGIRFPGASKSGSEIRKTTTLLLLKLERVMKGFCKYLGSKRKTKENVNLLLYVVEESNLMYSMFSYLLYFLVTPILGLPSFSREVAESRRLKYDSQQRNKELGNAWAHGTYKSPRD